MEMQQYCADENIGKMHSLLCFLLNALEFEQSFSSFKFNHSEELPFPRTGLPNIGENVNVIWFLLLLLFQAHACTHSWGKAKQKHTHTHALFSLARFVKPVLDPKRRYPGSSVIKRYVFVPVWIVWLFFTRQFRYRSSVHVCLCYEGGGGCMPCKAFVCVCCAFFLFRNRCQ